MDLDYIISYLADDNSKKIIEKKEERKEKIIEKLECNIEDYNEDLKYLNHNLENNSLILSLIYLLNIENFKFVLEKLENEINIFKSWMNNEISLYEISKKLNINILVLGENKKVCSPSGVINLFLPFILLKLENGNYYPIFNDTKKVFFYMKDEFIEEILDEIEGLEESMPYEAYQFYEEKSEIIDSILEKNKDKLKSENTELNNIFTKSSSVEKMKKYNKMLKRDLISELIKCDSSLLNKKLENKTKKDLIDMLIKLNK